MTSPKKVFQEIEHWKPSNEITVNHLLNYSEPKNELLVFLYDLVKSENFPDRKDGKPHLVHPINVATYLQRAKADFLDVAAGLIHDRLEDKIDAVIASSQVDDVAQLETDLTTELEMMLLNKCQSLELPSTFPHALIATTELLTRYKRHNYYRSLGEMFSSDDSIIQERAIRVKLADRMHNIQCLSAFTENEKNYQAFKNLFIINNVKSYLMETEQVTTEDLILTRRKNATKKMFRKCLKATYDAFLSICHDSLDKGIKDIEPYIQVFYHKYENQTKNMKQISDWDNKEAHPLKLFDGIVKKYDARLHKETAEFNRRQQREAKFCGELFSDFKFTPEQLKAIVDYKDAYLMKEVTGKFYDEKFFVKNFGCGKLCSRGRICVSE
jgi:hypothetical protein